MAELWDVFLQLAAGRRAGGMAASSLTFTDIEAWCRLNHVQLTPWELDTLMACDAAALATAAAAGQRTQPTKA